MPICLVSVENGMPRFFKRLSEGVFDEKDLVVRTRELKDFIDEAAETHQFNRGRVIAVGYSNGANIAASLLFHYKDVLKGAILHHPMAPIRGIELPDMAGLLFLSVLGNTILFARRKNQKSFTAIYVTAGHQPPFTGRTGPSADSA